MHLHIDLYIALAGLIVGTIVGLTGMGGGALMTPILVILFRVHPLAAVSSDLVAAVVMKPFGAALHARRRTVNWELVAWLVVGSVPSAFAGVLVLRMFGSHAHIDNAIKFALGCALIVAAFAIVFKAYRQTRLARDGVQQKRTPVVVNPLLTVAIGAVGGFVVGMTSVGSGSLIIVMLMLLYKWMPAKRLVGTDLVQAIPLVGSAALAHVLFGDFKLALTLSLLAGSIPGVIIGAQLSAYAPNIIVRPVLFFVLLASALKLLNVGNIQLVEILGIMAVVGLPVWGLIDASRWSPERWALVGRSRQRWMTAFAAGAPALVGAFAALAYFIVTRPQLMQAAGKARLT